MFVKKLQPKFVQTYSIFVVIPNVPTISMGYGFRNPIVITSKFCVCTMYVYTIVYRKYLPTFKNIILSADISKFTKTMFSLYPKNVITPSTEITAQFIIITFLNLNIFVKRKTIYFLLLFSFLSFKYKKKNPFPIVIRRDVNRWYVAVRVTNHRR